MNKIHFVGDIDSMYWAVSGSETDNYEQWFKHVIEDHAFYNENIYKYILSNFCSFDSFNPTFNSETQRTAFNKKLLGFAIEKQCENMINLIIYKLHPLNVKVTANRGSYILKIILMCIPKRRFTQKTNNNIQIKKI
jgi:hypothetical protein